MKPVCNYRDDMGAMVYQLGYGVVPAKGPGYGIHRADGPAIVWDDGSFCWWLYDELHRYYGPTNSVDDWYLYAERVK